MSFTISNFLSVLDSAIDHLKLGDCDDLMLGLDTV